MTAKTPKDDVEELGCRDLFAMLAMCGLIMHHGGHPRGNKIIDDIKGAERAYEIADAMLREREKNGFKNTY